MRRSIATVSLSGMLREKLQAAAAARFDGVEIFENDLLQFPGSPRDVRCIAEDLGLSIDMFQPFRDFDGVTPAQLLRNLDRAERKFDVMDDARSANPTIPERHFAKAQKKIAKGDFSFDSLKKH